MKIIDNKRYIFFFLFYPSFSPGTFQDFFLYRVVFFKITRTKLETLNFILMARLLSSKIIVLSIFLFFSQLSDNYDIGNNNSNGINESDKIFLNFCFQNTKILVCFFEQVVHIVYNIGTILCNVKISVFSSFPNSNCNILLFKVLNLCT